MQKSLCKKLSTLTLILALTCLVLAVQQAPAQSEPPPAGRTASVNGMEMYYEVHGEGTPLVMLHGFSGSGQYWKPYVADFAQDYRVIVPDLRGHGRSTNPTNEFTHRQAALDVYALLDHLGIDRFKGMGTSTGAMTLIHMATQQPRRVEAMILIAGTIYFPEQARAIMRKATPESLTPEQWNRYRNTHKHGDEQIRALRAQFHAFKDSYDDMNFTKPYLSTITASTFIVHGDRDAFFPISIPVEMYRWIPEAYLWVVPNAGHGPIQGRHQEFVRMALEFLRGDWDKGE